MPKKQLRLPSSTWPPAASRWLHARPARQLSEPTAKERAPMTTSASGGRREALPGTGRSLPGMSENRKIWKSQHRNVGTNRCCVDVHVYTTQEQGLYQRMCVRLYDTYGCANKLLCTYSTSRGRGEAWRGKNRHIGPALAWFDHLFFFLFSLSVYPPPSLA